MLQIYMVCGLPQNKNILLQYYKEVCFIKNMLLQCFVACLKAFI